MNTIKELRAERKQFLAESRGVAIRSALTAVLTGGVSRALATWRLACTSRDALTREREALDEAHALRSAHATEVSTPRMGCQTLRTIDTRSLRSPLPALAAPCARRSLRSPL